MLFDCGAAEAKATNEEANASFILTMSCLSVQEKLNVLNDAVENFGSTCRFCH